ncbi:MAG: hypothetical protein ACYCSF_02220 [Acidimicrobiales bacterium]
MAPQRRLDDNERHTRGEALAADSEARARSCAAHRAECTEFTRRHSTIRSGATALTRAFSGRRVRGLINRFVIDHDDAPAAHRGINNATRPLPAAAAGRATPVGRNGMPCGDGPAAGEILEGLSAMAPR